MFKYFTAALLTIYLLIFPVSYPAAGGLSSEIDNMFNNFGFKANTTEPGAYMAQTHGMIVGGSLNVRSSSKPVELFSISPPSIKAGCGGLDMYFGGVSFVNLQQFQQMLLAIGQNAVGYAFELGIEAVCPTCNSVLKDLKTHISHYFIVKVGLFFILMSHGEAEMIPGLMSSDIKAAGLMSSALR